MTTYIFAVMVMCLGYSVIGVHHCPHFKPNVHSASYMGVEVHINHSTTLLNVNHGIINGLGEVNEFDSVTEQSLLA